MKSTVGSETLNEPTPSEEARRKKTLGDLDPESLRGQVVLLRVDYNVPLDDHLLITDDARILHSLPTLRFLLQAGARVVILSHFDRPNGRRVESMSLAPVSVRLSTLLDRDVRLLNQDVEADVIDQVRALPDGHALLLENTRFDPGEERNDPSLAGRWAELGSVYVNDAFGAAHRAHASTDGLPRRIRERGGQAVAGFLMERELRILGTTLRHPKRPFVAVIGGAKISGKIDVVEALLPTVDHLLIGGAMANTFFLAMGLDVGRSLVEEDGVEMAVRVMSEAGDKLILPVDAVVTTSLESGADARAADRTEVAANESIADIGPRTRELFANVLSIAETVVWNGPMGVFEAPPFDQGTIAVAHSVASASDRGAVTVLGGGDSTAAAEAAGVTDRLTHVSTGGGASLEFLAGATLPGVDALSDDRGGS